MTTVKIQNLAAIEPESDNIKLTFSNSCSRAALPQIHWRWHSLGLRSSQKTLVLQNRSFGLRRFCRTASPRHSQLCGEPLEARQTHPQFLRTRVRVEQYANLADDGAVKTSEKRAGRFDIFPSFSHVRTRVERELEGSAAGPGPKFSLLRRQASEKAHSTPPIRPDADSLV